LSNKSLGFCAAILAALAFTVPAAATEVLNTTYNGWLSTVTGSASEWNFSFPSSTYDTASGYNLNVANVAAYGTINVTGPDGGGYYLEKNSAYAGNNLALQSASDGIGSMDFTTQSAGLTAFLFGLGLTGNAAPITITLSDGETFTANPAINGTAFVGLSSATPITSFVLSTASGSQVQLDDFFAGVSNQPAAPDAPAAEVATALMIGGGLLLLGGIRKVYSNISAAKR
jgi:hypothetical protein